MIISHKHKFIFIKTVKTAGTSIEILLSTICGENDIITSVSPPDELVRKQLGGIGPINTKIPFNKYSFRNVLGAIKKGERLHFYNHMSAEQIKGFISNEVWSNYYKFCFERNPLDKFISWYIWKGGDSKFGSINNFLRHPLALQLRGPSLYTINNDIVVNDIYKLEEMSAAIDNINQKLGTNLDYRKIPRTKVKSKQKDKSEYLTNEVIQFVRDNYLNNSNRIHYTV